MNKTRSFSDNIKHEVALSAMQRERSLEVYIRENANHGKIMISLGQIFGNISAVCSVTWVSAVICGRVFDFHRAYLVILDKQQKEKVLYCLCVLITEI